MSNVVTVQLGQCGNQVGGELFSCLSAELPREFFCERENKTRSGYRSRGKAVARAVLIDMEPKAITATLKRPLRDKTGWTYGRRSHHWKHSGSANNWSYGYSVHGPSSCDNILDLTRRQAERCDSVGGFLLLSSLAGGTGSGLGAYTAELIRDNFPKVHMLNQVVWPFASGDVIVQGYNSILTLSHLLRVSDGIVTFSNDVLRDTATRLHGIKSPSFDDMNRLLARSMASALLPSTRVGGGRVTFSDQMVQLFPHCGYKFSAVRRMPQASSHAKQFNSYTWRLLLKHLQQMQLTGADMEEKVDWSVSPEGRQPPSSINRSVAAVVTLRGEGARDAARKTATGKAPERSKGPRRRLTDKETAEQREAAEMAMFFAHRPMYTDWSFDPVVRTYNPLCFDQNSRSASVWSNSQSIVGPLDTLVSGAWNKFSSDAYVHHYIKHGVDRKNFIRAFAGLEQVISDYKKL